MVHAGLAVRGAEESRGAAHSIAGTEVKVEAAPSSGRDERLVGAADNRAASRLVTYLRIVIAARAICLAGSAAPLYGRIGLSARCCAARGSADAKDASGWENAGRVAWSTCGHGGRGSERGGGGGNRAGRRARRAGDDGDEIGDAVLRQPLHRERVGDALTVVRILCLELREAALRRVMAAGVLRHGLVDAALRVRVRRLPRRLGKLPTLEQHGQVLRSALRRARAPLRLIARLRADR